MAARTIKASEFKAKCLKLTDEINVTGDTSTVTEDGKPVIEVRPARGAQAKVARGTSCRSGQDPRRHHQPGHR